MILNGLPWKRIEIILFVFEIASKYCILESFVYYEGYCISFMEKAMAPHSSTLAWKIPWMEEPGRLGVGHD